MKKAQLKAAQIVDQILAKIKVSVGLTEKDVAAQIKALLKKFNAKPAFKIIVASGKRSSLPHGFATTKKIRSGEFVVVDFGALYNGYRSDITRTFLVGRPSKKQRMIYQTVKKAQDKAIKAVRAGKICAEIDLAARGYIEKAGYGRYFIHTTGHGISKKVHEAPKISKRNRRRLRAGAVITIEPGIYIKGFGGVRIEDMVLVTKTGCKILTKTKK